MKHLPVILFIAGSVCFLLGNIAALWQATR